MRILVSSAGFPPAYLGGGPIRTIAAMLDRASDRHEIFVITNNYDVGSSEPLVQDGSDWKRCGNARILYVSAGLYSIIWGIVRSLIQRPDAVYLNSIFSFRNSILIQAVARLIPGVHLVIAPRGELDPGALALKAAKKSRYIRLVKGLRLLDSAIWHASSELEAGNIRRVFPAASRIIVRENDTLLPVIADRSQIIRSTADTEAPLWCVFLSRLSPKKGLHVALEALAHVKSAISLDVIGPAEDLNYVERCQRIVADLPSHVTVRFLGPVEPDDIRPTLAMYDLMVFPTAGENFGHVIAESLSVGCPVMCSDSTPWSNRLSEGGGVLVGGHQAAEWGRALDKFADGGPEEWVCSRQRAADAFDQWRNDETAPHFFDLLEATIFRSFPKSFE